MKAVIVDLDGNNAVALCDDGRFEKIKNKNFSIGQEIVMQPQTIRFPKQAAIAASAAIVIATCGGMGTYTWCNPVSYVSLDINPSIAYSLNAFNRVIAVSGMNDEGTAIVDAIGDSLKNADITTALTITVEQLSTDAYLDTENANYMVIGVYSDKDSKANALLSTVDEFTANSVELCSVTTVNISKEAKETADTYGITGGKMELINEIANVAADPKEVDPAALVDLTVAELEQTKNVAASGASITEAVASAMPAEEKNKSVETKQTQVAENKPAQTAENTPAQTPENTQPPQKPVAEQPQVQTPEPTPEIPAAPSSDSSESKPSENATSTSSTPKDEPSEVKPSNTTNSSDGTAPVVTPADSDTETDTVSGNDTGSTSNAGSNSNSASNSGNKNENGSSDKKDESGSSPSKEDTTSSDKKDESASSDKKDDSTSSDKKDESASSDKKDEVYEDTSQQTHSGPIVDHPDEPIVEIPVFDDGLIVCSMPF